MSGTKDLAQKLNRIVHHLKKSVHARARDLDHDKVGPSGAILLMMLCQNGPVPIQHLVQLTGRDKGQMTRKIKELEAKGLVSRSRDPDDARVNLLTLTHKGDSLHSRFEDVMNDVVRGMLEPLTEEERTQFSAILNKIQT